MTAAAERVRRAWDAWSAAGDGGLDAGDAYDDLAQAIADLPGPDGLDARRGVGDLRARLALHEEETADRLDAIAAEIAALREAASRRDGWIGCLEREWAAARADWEARLAALEARAEGTDPLRRGGTAAVRTETG